MNKHAMIASIKDKNHNHNGRIMNTPRAGDHSANQNKTPYFSSKLHSWRRAFIRPLLCYPSLNLDVRRLWSILRFRGAAGSVTLQFD
jgi:hypothetical protein